MVKPFSSRYAFTLIELIFAIVVISISVISLPMMTQTTSKGMDANLVQEAIFAASAELNGAITAHWDENALEDDSNSLSRVIDINADNDCGTDHLSPGHIAQPFHRRCLKNNATAPLDGTNDANIVALEDMAHGTQSAFSDSGTAQGYKKNYTSTVTVSRNVDFNGSNANIKMLELEIRDADDNLVTLLRAYSSNIGEIDFYKRRYQ